MTNLPRSRDRRAKHASGEITIQLEGYPSDVWAATRQLEAAGFKILNQHERCVLLVGRITPDTYNAQSQSPYFKAMRRG